MLQVKTSNAIFQVTESILNDFERPIPVPVVKIANQFGLQVVEYKFKKASISGMLIDDYEDGEWGIVINENEPRQRQRFTIAHELGHFLLHTRTTGEQFVDMRADLNVFYRAVSFGNSSQEQDANLFAANLLMPKEEVQEYYEATQDIKETADYFDVSQSAMNFRLTNLRLIT